MVLKFIFYTIANTYASMLFYSHAYDLVHSGEHNNYYYCIITKIHNIQSIINMHQISYKR